MRTTILMQAGLFQKAKFQALRGKMTFTAILENALRLFLKDEKPEKRGKIKLPTSGKGGLLPGVDLDDSSSLNDRMDGLTKIPLP